MNICPCGTGELYCNCCEPLHKGASRAINAEQLMRSRYSAFVTKNVDYLVKTHDKKTRPKHLKQELLQSISSIKWLRLEIHHTTKGLPNDKEGYVHFTAHYSENGRIGNMEELSHFTKRKGVWYYTSGSIK